MPRDGRESLMTCTCEDGEMGAQVTPRHVQQLVCCCQLRDLLEGEMELLKLRRSCCSENGQTSCCDEAGGGK